MSEWSSGDVISNGIRIHYHRTGAGDKPPLVLCHGVTDSGLCWTPIAQELESDYDIIMPDARGHGLSEAPNLIYAPEEMAADLIGLLEALEIERPALMGHSMGGNMITFVAGMRPDLPRCLVLEDPAWHPREGAEGEDRAQHLAEMGQNALKLQELSREEIIAHCRQQSPSWPEAELGPWADSKLQLSAKLASPDTVQMADIKWQELVERFACPALLLTADTNKGSIISAESAREAQSLWHSGRVVHFPEAGHNIRREAPERYVKVVKEFLAERMG